MTRDGVILCPLETPREDAREDFEVSLEERQFPLVLDFSCKPLMEGAEDVANEIFIT